MKKKDLFILLFALGLFAITSCNRKTLFVQPSIQVTGVSLKELPQDSTHLIIDLKIKNNDTRKANIIDASYQATIDGLVSGAEKVELNKTIETDSPLVVSLPLTLLTTDALKLLKKLNKGESLNYHVTGTFHVNEKHLKNFDLPLDVTGTTNVKVGYDDFFKQPSIEVTGISLKELPQDSAHLLIDLKINNNDTKEATILDASYQAKIDSFFSGTEHVVLNKTIQASTPLVTSLPLTLLTADAITLLKKLNKGESLPYNVTGIFHLNEKDLKKFDLPLLVSGTADVKVGYDDFFKQPEVTVDSIDGKYSLGGNFPNFTYTFNLKVHCSVKNVDSHSVEIDEVTYVVTTEGIKSNQELYSDAYPGTTISINAGDSININLPVTYVLNNAEGAQLASGLSDGYANYIVKGTFHTIKVNGISNIFELPLYETGKVPVTSLVQQ